MRDGSKRTSIVLRLSGNVNIVIFFTTYVKCIAPNSLAALSC